MKRKKLYVLRTCGKDLKSHGGFQWPKKGIITAPDWKPTNECGNGLHGLLWGEGDYSLLDWSEDAAWLVVEVIGPHVDLTGKVKFKKGRVVHVGDRMSAVAKIIGLGADPAKCVGGTATAGAGGTATAGNRGTATAGNRGTATAGAGGTATAGNHGTATAGDGGTATAGVDGTATAGNHGTATAGAGGTATAGNRGTATAGNHGTATAGVGGTATAGAGGTATAGYHGTVCVKDWDPSKQRYRIIVGYPGEDGIEANVAYKVENGKLVRA